MSDVDLIFGWRTALLGGAALQCLLLAAALFAAGGNRVANRFLAAALVVIAGLLAPYALGFAGVYNRFPAITFIPLAAPLALGPLLYLYSRALMTAQAPRQTWAHLGPAMLQWLYLAVCFLLPWPWKWDWYVGGHRAWIAPVFDLLAPISLAAYALATARALRVLRARLADQRSDDDRFAAAWLGRVVVALGLGVALEAGFWLWSVITGGTDYFQETGLYLGLGVLGIYLGVEGWRQAALPAPLSEPPTLPAEAAPGVDWANVGASLRAQTEAGGWWREPELSLPRLARLAGTNTGRVSRAVNLGLGVNFSVFVNRLRAEAVADALRAGHGGDLLDLALEMGFSSKASFNRAFRDRFGVSPSQYRRNVSDPDFLSAEPNLTRVAAPVAAE